MADERLRSKSELKRLFTNLRSKPITEEMMSIAIDSLWRDKLVQRTSGFEFPAHFDSEFSFNTSTRIFSIQPWDPQVEGFLPRYGVYSYLDHPIFHRHFEPFEIEIPDEEGLFCLYFDNEPAPGNSLILFYKKNPTAQELETIYISKILVSCFYWDAENSDLLHFGDDRHGSEWNPQMHLFLHNAFHARRKSGLQFTGYSLNGDGSSNDHAKFSITEGILLHDDFAMEIPASTTTIPVLYSLGTYPRFLANNGYAFAGASRAYFNSGQNTLVQAASGNFVLYHIFATNEILTETRKIISVMGIAQYTTIGAAHKAIDSELNSVFSYMPYQGRCYLGSVIFHTSDDFTNDTNTIIVALSANKTHPPVTIALDSNDYLSIDENQIITFFPWQVDYEEADVNSPFFIKNKPNLAKAFTDLTDVIPEDYITKAKHVPIVTDDEKKLELIGTEEIETVLAALTQLADCPPSFTGKGGFTVKVRLDETGIEFVAP